MSESLIRFIMSTRAMLAGQLNTIKELCAKCLIMRGEFSPTPSRWGIGRFLTVRGHVFLRSTTVTQKGL